MSKRSYTGYVLIQIIWSVMRKERNIEWRLEQVDNLNARG